MNPLDAFIADLDPLVVDRLDALASPAQRFAALAHLIRGNMTAAEIVLAANPAIYRDFDIRMNAAYLAGVAAAMQAI